MTLNEKQIAAYEAKGAKRWTKSSMDRLYFNATDYGCEFDYYGTGNIRSCRFDGERVSNAEGYRFKSSKVFIDVNTGELSVTTSTSYEDEIREAVEAIMAEVEAETAEPEIAEESEIATEEDTKPVWSDLQEAIVTAHEAVRALAGYGVCGSEPELGGKVDALNAELEAWVRGMAVLAEQGAAHVDRASVMAASERRCEEVQNAIVNGGGVFQSEIEEEGEEEMAKYQIIIEDAAENCDEVLLSEEFADEGEAKARYAELRDEFLAEDGGWRDGLNLWLFADGESVDGESR